MHLNRRTFCMATVAAGMAPHLADAAPAVAATTRGGKIPVILHTDIGVDVDDTFALLWLLRRPELDLKLVVTDKGNTAYRARLAAKLLTLAGRGDVGVAYGPDAGDAPGPQSAWVGGFALKDYAGRVRPDGAQAIVDTVMGSPDPVTIIGIGAATLTAAALALEPRIAHKARFVGKHGSVRVSYDGSTTTVAESNVKDDPAALRAVFAAGWPVTITPLDTCGTVVLDGADWRRLRASSDPFARACIANSEVWLPTSPWMPKDFDLTKTSSVLFDTVAVALAFDERDMAIETLRLRLTDDGMTVLDPQGRPVRVATKWKNLAGFKRRLVADLTREQA